MEFTWGFWPLIEWRSGGWDWIPRLVFQKEMVDLPLHRSCNDGHNDLTWESQPYKILETYGHSCESKSVFRRHSHVWKATHGLLPLPRGCVSEEKRNIYKLWPPGMGITSLQVVTSGIQLGESPPVGTSNILNSKLRGFVWDWLWMLAHPKGFEFSSKLGEDMPERDPVEWVLHASADNVEPWQLLNFFLIFFSCYR